MSFETWIYEFYPVDAEYSSPDEAAQQSLRKWRGVTQDHLAEHGVTFRNRVLQGPTDKLEFGNTTCALCFHYYDNILIDEDDSEQVCVGCPLAAVRGNVPCFDRMPDEKQSPWAAATHDVRPMVRWLEKAVEFEEQSK